MGEIKSVKVDNWGVFFLQKLQNFFNKTDYCDLTLQFNDNSQLKVHKLVLSACTDYFNVLEQTCEMIDDILIMPNELQADLVVPIVNFMYTGTLEFELKMYGKLLKTARDMNMTVLLKLLEAHRRTMEGGTKQVVRNTKTSPRQTYLNAGLKPTASIPTIIDVSGNTPQAKRRILSTRIEPYRKLQIKPISSTTYSDTNTILTSKYSNTKVTPIKGPSRFEYEGENILQDTFESSFDTISYESKPLKEEHIEDEQHNIKQESTTSLQFEQLRRTGYNNNKRPAQSILQSPPAKKPNIQDVKEYAEQQRMRKQIAEEYGEEFEDTLDDEFHNADDDEEYISAPLQHQISNKTISTTSTISLKQKAQQQNQINKKATTNLGINIKQEEKPRIVVKDSTSSNVDHAKIISEVLRKYPHLIKNNKNIKLKIMPNASGNGGPQRVVIKKESDTNISPTPSTSKTAGIQETKLLKFSAPTQQKISAGQVQPAVSTTVQPPSTSTTSQQPRRIDSKTMKALISLGAENTTGPWLCLRCGVNGRPISIPSYRGFRRHLINTHKEVIDPRLCEHCGWRSTTHKELLFHMQMEHQVKCNINFPKCEHCGIVVLDLASLDDHIDAYHPENKQDNQQCIYCNKTFSTEILLYNHMKAQHKERARDDGVIDFSDDEHAAGEFDDEDGEIDINSYEQESNQKPSSSKIQILSDINLPKCISLTKTTTDLSAITITTSDSTTLTNVDYITTSAGLDTDNGPKFVNAEGNVMELTPAQRDEIISQLEQSGDGVVMVLNDESFVNDEKLAGIVESSTSKMQSITSQQFADNNMLIVYDQQQPITTTTTIISEKNNEKIIEENQKKRLGKQVEEQDDAEAIEWKNDTSQEVPEKETTEVLGTEENIKEKTNEKEIKGISNIKKQDKDSSDLDMKLKLLTGDWTDDEDDECQDAIAENEKEKKDKGDDQILHILEKNNDSSDVKVENVKTEVKQVTMEDNVKNEADTAQPLEGNEEIQNASGKPDDIEKIQPTKGSEEVATNEQNDKEENFESYPEDYDKDEEILFSTEISLTEAIKTVGVTEKDTTKPETDDDKIPTKDLDAKENSNNTENVDKKENVEENLEKEIKETEITNVVQDFSVDDEGNHGDTNKKQIDDTEKLENDENLKKSDNVKPVSESKDENDELSQTKTKDEIKNLISEWGEDDDDL